MKGRRVGMASRWVVSGRQFRVPGLGGSRAPARIGARGAVDREERSPVRNLAGFEEYPRRAGGAIGSAWVTGGQENCEKRRIGA